MKKNCFLLISLLALTLTTHAQQAGSELVMATDRWFRAWELLSKEVYHLNKFYPVDFVFFDSTNVYSTSPVSAGGQPVLEKQPFMNQLYDWKKAPHNGIITLPDSSKIPVGMMCFAGQNALEKKPFFVMPLPSFWKSFGVTSAELGLDNLITGVFLHEFSHSQQMQNFGKKITAFEKTADFGVEFTDNIVQDIFESDSSFTHAFRNETTLLYDAVAENDETRHRKILQQALMAMSIRQQQYFRDRYKDLLAMDDFFLTMEGLGQYSMYAWLTHPDGAGLSKNLAIKGVRRGKKQWSQDEGFALFLLLEKYAAPAEWGPAMFETDTTPVKYLLMQYMPAKK